VKFYNYQASEMKSNFKMNIMFLWILLIFSVVTQPINCLDDYTQKKLIPLKVYLLHSHVNIDDALKDKVFKEIRKYDCKVNRGCIWYTKPETRKLPEFWNFVKQGTGVDLKENTFENWLYYVESNGNKFGIVFGKGEFFKRENHRIDEKYGVSNFGYEIVKNIVEDPDEVLTEKKGTLEGKPYNGFCPSIKGSDFCSLTLKHSIEEIPSICHRLWQYSQRGDYQLLETIKEKADECGKEVIDVTDDVFEFIEQNHQKEEESGEEEDKEIEYADGKVAVKIFGKYFAYEGLKEYSERTKEDVKKLIQEDIIKLPDFKAGDLLGSEESEESHSKSEEKSVDWEYLYNISASKIQELMLLDRRCVENIEVCDLLDSTNKKLVHVKIGTKSSALNHLFGQGMASAELLKKQEYRKKIPLDVIRQKVCQSCKKLSKGKSEYKEICKMINGCFKNIENKEIKTYNDLRERFLEEYKKKKIKQISDDEIVKIFDASEDIKVEFQKLYDAFVCWPMDAEKKFSIIYAIITHKDPESKREFLPLGARINLLKNVKELMKEERESIKFEVFLKIISDAEKFFQKKEKKSEGSLPKRKAKKKELEPTAKKRKVEI